MGMAKRGINCEYKTKKYTIHDSIEYNDLNAGPVIKDNGGNYKGMFARLLIQKVIQ